MNENDQLFLVSAAMTAFRKTERVLLFHQVAPEFQKELSLAPYAQVLSTLCHEQGRNLDGLVYFQRIQQLVDRQQTDGVDTGQSIEAREAVRKYEQWLQATFPEAHGPACGLPSRAVHRLCERCGKRTATVHFSKVTDGVTERHEFCEPCGHVCRGGWKH